MFGFLHNRTKYVNARFWPYQSGFIYPEAELESLDGKADFGVAFSGGGTRSASATLGQLRGLKAIGFLDKLKYVSAVSGGSWGCAPFIFLPDEYDDETFLGEDLAPNEISVQSLRSVSKRSMAQAISSTVITDDFFSEAAKFAGDETYSRAIGNLFLDPFNIGENDMFFVHDRTLRDAAVARNAKADNDEHYLKPGDFFVAKQDRPFIIAGATILARQGGEERKLPVEFTPWYSGVRSYFDFDDPVGGGYLETFGYDSVNPEGDDIKRNGNEYNLRLKLGSKRHRFALSDMIGTSGAAPQEFLHSHLITAAGFPEFRHWAFKDGAFSDDNEYTHGDGGHIENLGIMPLLARKVRNIIVFINGKTPFEFDPGEPRESKMASSIKNLFIASEDGFDLNVIFKDAQKFDALIEGFAACAENQDSLIWCDTYDVKDNDHHLVEAYDGVRICWVYNQKVGKWVDQLNFDLRKLIGKGDLKKFPHYKTFFQNPPKIIDLTKVQVGLLAHLSCWNLVDKKEKLQEFFKEAFA